MRAKIWIPARGWSHGQISKISSIRYIESDYYHHFFRIQMAIYNRQSEQKSPSKERERETPVISPFVRFHKTHVMCHWKGLENIILSFVCTHNNSYCLLRWLCVIILIHQHDRQRDTQNKWRLKESRSTSCDVVNI